ncbi:hypothetical protein AB0C12_12755 [Actinoplanes sp. NPDC048967]|uniref:hypothetical protein n=1 Tax=Actinoplanes sp. NPDC048967 TaxID=3155269 RepID=UPI00340156E0
MQEIAVRQQPDDPEEHGVPEPVDASDADGVAGNAWWWRRPRPVLAVMAVLLVVTASVAPLMVDRTTKLSVADVPLRLSALEHRVRLGETGKGAMDTTALVHPGEGTLVADRDTGQIFLLEAADNRLCVLTVNEGSGGAGTQCWPRSDLLTTGVVQVYAPVESGSRVIVVVAPDGYTKAAAGDTSAVVSANAAVLELMAPQHHLTLSGPGMPTVTFTLTSPGATAAAARHIAGFATV